MMLVCVSSMGMGGMMTGEVSAEKPSPCHQEVSKKDMTSSPCETCKDALEVWEEEMVSASDTIQEKTVESILSVASVVEIFNFKLNLIGVYQTYYPPPQVLLKAVTPNTKTIVLLS